MTPDQLPPLPERRIRHVYNESKGYACDCWAEDAVRAYATAATAALRAEMDALRRDAERYQWLSVRLLAADFDYNGEGVEALVFELPGNTAVSADCDATIDAAMKETP